MTINQLTDLLESLEKTDFSESQKTFIKEVLLALAR